MSPELSLVLLTVVATAIGGLIVNWTWHAWQKRAKVRWFSIAEISIPDDTGFLKSLKALVTRSYDERDLLSSEVRERINEIRYEERRIFKLGIENLGMAPARKVSILFSKEPSSLQTSPRVGIKKEATADGSYIFEIDSVAAKQILYVTAFQTSKNSIEGIFYDGESLRETHASLIGPYFPERKFALTGLLWAFAAGTLFFSLLFSPSGPISKYMNADKSQEKTTTEEAPEERP